jgi:hypothetical protein
MWIGEGNVEGQGCGRKECGKAKDVECGFFFRGGVGVVRFLCENTLIFQSLFFL